MPSTAGTFNQITANTDGQQVLGPEYFRDTTAAATITYAAGVLTLNAAATTAPNLVATVDLFSRTGMAINRQGQFGTAAGVPGPSAVPNTSGPGLNNPIPPILKANLPTLTGGVRGFLPKGCQINSLIIDYKIGGANLTSMVVGLYSNQAVAGQANPTQTVLLASAQNGLSLAFGANIQSTTIPLLAANQVMQVTPKAQVVFNLAPVVPAGATFTLYGVTFNVSFNFN